MSTLPTAPLSTLLPPGALVAFGDGIGAPRAVSAELSAAAATVPGLRLLLGWMPTSDPGLDLGTFADVRCLMSGWGLRRAVDEGRARAVPTRLSTIPALLHGPLRPDVLIASVVAAPGGGYTFGTEVSWMRAAVAAGARVAGVLARRTPRCDAGEPLPADRLTLVGESHDPPATVAFSAPSAEHRAIAEHIAALLPTGTRLQVGPGALGSAVLDAVPTPVVVESGLLPDGVVGLDRRGLLAGHPTGAYLAGGAELLDWAAADGGRAVLHPIEYTHDLGRLSTGVPFVAVNTAIEIDEQGQVNVEGLPGAAVGGIGGHADYAAAATRSVGGLSIVALPSRHRGRPVLVDSLSAPVSTPAHDVDVVVTEAGSTDLRGLDRAERASALGELWRRSAAGTAR